MLEHDDEDDEEAILGRGGRKSGGFPEARESQKVQPEKSPRAKQREPVPEYQTTLRPLNQNVHSPDGRREVLILSPL